MNTLYYGDNLAILRAHIADESVDLIYHDLPFNFNADYNIIFKERTGGLPAERKSPPSRTPGPGAWRPRGAKP